MRRVRAAAKHDTPWRVVFLMERAESWINVHGLWSITAADERFTPEVRVIAHDPDETTAHRKRRACYARLAAAGVSVQGIAEDTPRPLDTDEFDIAVFNTPYDRERPPSFHFDRIASQVDLTVYVPYGLVMGAGRRNRHYQYRQRTQRDADLVIARSDAERSLYRKYCPSGDRHVVVTGLPRMDELHELEHFEVDPALRNAIGERFAVLWNSHFSFGLAFADGANYSTFDILARQLFDTAISRPDIALIWRPHPTLFRVLVDEGILATEQVDEFRRDVQASGVILDERPDHRHAFAASDMLLTDLGSFLVEYLATGKPLVYLMNEHGEGLNEEGASLVEHIDTARSGSDVLSFIDLYRSGADPKRHLRKIARERYLPLLDGNASHRVVERIALVMGETAIERQEPTLLKHVLDSLDHLRAVKVRRSRKQSVIGRLWDTVKVEGIEWIKRHPTLLRIAERRRKRR